LCSGPGNGFQPGSVQPVAGICQNINPLVGQSAMPGISWALLSDLYYWHLRTSQRCQTGSRRSAALTAGMLPEFPGRPARQEARMPQELQGVKESVMSRPQPATRAAPSSAPPATHRTSKMAIWSLVLSILWLGGLGSVAGILLGCQPVAGSPGPVNAALGWPPRGSWSASLPWCSRSSTGRSSPCIPAAPAAAAGAVATDHHCRLPGTRGRFPARCPRRESSRA
jgi:hypothetical protein